MIKYNNKKIEVLEALPELEKIDDLLKIANNEKEGDYRFTFEEQIPIAYQQLDTIEDDSGEVKWFEIYLIKNFLLNDFKDAIADSKEYGEELPDFRNPSFYQFEYIAIEKDEE